jgi:RHS repeat-associated protein
MENKYGYQGDYNEEETETGWDEFELRMYDPQIGRWMGADPYDEFASPYIAMGNDPIGLTDPSGGFTIGDFTGSAAWDRFFISAGGAVVGAGIGALLSKGDAKSTWVGGIIGGGIAFGSTYINWQQFGIFLGNVGNNISTWVNGILNQRLNLVWLPGSRLVKEDMDSHEEPSAYFWDNLIFSAKRIIGRNRLKIVRFDSIDELFKKMLLRYRKSKIGNLIIDFHGYRESMSVGDLEYNNNSNNNAIERNGENLNSEYLLKKIGSTFMDDKTKVLLGNCNQGNYPERLQALQSTFNGATIYGHQSYSMSKPLVLKNSYSSKRACSKVYARCGNSGKYTKVGPGGQVSIVNDVKFTWGGNLYER